MDVKKRKKHPQIRLKEKWFLKTTYNGTTFYLQQQTSGAYTGMGSGIGTKSKIKIVKAQNDKYFIFLKLLQGYKKIVPQ